MKRVIQRQKKIVGFLSVLSFGIFLSCLSYLYRPQPTNEETAGVPAPTPIPDARWQDLKGELSRQSAKFQGKTAVYLKDLKSEREWFHNVDDLFPSASLIKVPIMACVFKKIQENNLTLLTPLKLTRQTRVGGSGTLKWHRLGSTFSVGELLYHMITESDNTATHILVDNLGNEYLKEGFKNLNLTYTNFSEQGLRLTSSPVFRENYTTAREMGLLLEKIYRKELYDPAGSETMLELLKEQKHRDRLGRLLPSGWMIANKTGLLRRACHDAGIIFTSDGHDYILVVLTWKAPNYKMAKHFIAKVGKTTYRYFAGESDIASAKAGTVLTN